MFEKLIPVILALLAVQILIRVMQKKRRTNQSPSRNFDYKKRIDQLMKISNYDEGVNSEQAMIDEIRSGLGKPDMISGIPDNMRSVRRDLNLIIDAVTQGVKSKTGKTPVDAVRYHSPEKMFDEIVEVIRKHSVS